MPRNCRVLPYCDTGKKETTESLSLPRGHLGMRIMQVILSFLCYLRRKGINQPVVLAHKASRYLPGTYFLLVESILRGSNCEDMKPWYAFLERNGETLLRAKVKPGSCEHPLLLHRKPGHIINIKAVRNNAKPEYAFTRLLKLTPYLPPRYFAQVKFFSFVYFIFPFLPRWLLICDHFRCSNQIMSSTIR